MEPSKRSVVFKAICDLAKECQPDLLLVEVVPISVLSVDIVGGRLGVRDVQRDGVWRVGVRA